MKSDQSFPVATPDVPPAAVFDTPDAAVERLKELYRAAAQFLCEHFVEALAGTTAPSTRYRAFYPEIRISTTSYASVDSRLSFGHVAEPGTYATTITRPDLFDNYLRQQIALVMGNHDIRVTVGPSETPMPVHFAVAQEKGIVVPQEGAAPFTLRDVFDVPDLSTTNDEIVNGFGFTYPDGASPLAPFTAQRVDYSLARLSHYTATDPEHFQNHVLFTNYQFYVEEFEAYARAMLGDAQSGYASFVATGNQEITGPDDTLELPAKLPQMPP